MVATNQSTGSVIGIEPSIIAQVGSIKGDVFISRADTRSIAQPGDIIYSDDIISTATDAAALLYAANGNLLTLSQLSQVQFSPSLVQQIIEKEDTSPSELTKKNQSPEEEAELLNTLVSSVPVIEKTVPPTTAGKTKYSEGKYQSPYDDEELFVIWERNGDEIVPIRAFTTTRLSENSDFFNNSIGNTILFDTSNEIIEFSQPSSIFIPDRISAQADYMVVVEDSGPNIGYVSNNDSSTVNGPLTYALVGGKGVSNGQLIFNNDGSYTYTPNANFSGTDSFEYQVQDPDGNTSTATATISVTAVRDLSALSSSETTNEEIVFASTVATGNSTTSGGNLQYTLFSAPTNGSLTGPMNINTGAYTYTPNADYYGKDTFQYLVTDVASGESSVQTVTITVSGIDDLTAADDSLLIDHNSLLAGDVSLNDSTTSDGGDAGLIFSKLSDPDKGVLVFNSDGTYTYDSTGVDVAGGLQTFSYLVTDSSAQESSVQTVTITVNPANLPPEGTDSSATINEDGAYTLQLTDFGFSDVDGETFKAVRIDTLATAGVLTLSGVPVTADQIITIADINSNNLVYTPTANANGAPYGTFTFSVQASNDAFDTSPNTFTLNVNAINDIPAGTDNSATIDEDVVYTFAASDFGYNDIDGDALKAVRIDTLASAGSLTLDGVPLTLGQVVAVADINAGNLVFTPDANASGSPYGSFTFSVQDANDAFEASANTFTFNVTAVNDAPEGTNNSTTIDEDNSYTLLVSDFGFSDIVEGHLFTGVRIDTLPSLGSLTLSGLTVTMGQVVSIADITGGNLVFSPVANGNGIPYTSFTFSVQDSGGAVDVSPNTFTINVTPVSDLPVAENDSYDVIQDTPFSATLVNGVLANDSDDDGDTLVVDTTPVTNVSHGVLTLNVDGTFTYTPNADFNGSDSFTYEMNDGTGNTAQATVSIKVDYVSNTVLGTSGGDNLIGSAASDDDIYSGGVGEGEGAENVQGVGGTTSEAQIGHVGSGNDRLIFDADDSYVENASAGSGLIRIRDFTVGDVTTDSDADTLVLGDFLRAGDATFDGTAADAVRFFHFVDDKLLYIDREGGLGSSGDSARDLIDGNYGGIAGGASLFLEFKGVAFDATPLGETLNTEAQIQQLMDYGFLDFS